MTMTITITILEIIAASSIIINLTITIVLIIINLTMTMSDQFAQERKGGKPWRTQSRQQRQIRRHCLVAKKFVMEPKMSKSILPQYGDIAL